MKTLIIILSFIFLIAIQAQTVYEVQPGTKGNEIKLTVANVSEENSAHNVSIRPPQPLQRRGLQEEPIAFHQTEQTIDKLNPKEEREITFTFEVNRNAPISKKDTIEFLITDASGIMMTKQFIFNYTPPKEFKLEQNFPNPFNPTTTIQYQIPASPIRQGRTPKERTSVTLKIYDILGSEAATLVNEEQQPGYYEVQFNASGHSGNFRNLASGMYVYRLQAGEYVSVKKMLMVK